MIFSTSGNGNGFGKALEAARAAGGRVVALLGKGGGPLAGRADLELIVDSAVTARIQEAHQLLMHMVLEAVDREFA